MTDEDKWREWRKGEPGKLGWQEPVTLESDPPPRMGPTHGEMMDSVESDPRIEDYLGRDHPKSRERADEEVWKRMREQMQFDARNIYPLLYPGAQIPVPAPSTWWQRERFSILLAALGTLGVGALVALLVVTLVARGILPGDELQGRVGDRLTPTVDLCATRLLLTQGRLLKTQGEVLYWLETRDGGMDLYLVKEIGDGSPLECGMKAHLPPTIPETTWRPTTGERVTLCGLMLAAEHQARMGAAWRCV